MRISILTLIATLSGITSFQLQYPTVQTFHRLQHVVTSKEGNDGSKLLMAKVKKGKLGGEVDLENPIKSLTKPSRTRTTATASKRQRDEASKNKKKQESETDTISPDLAKWIAKQQSENEEKITSYEPNNKSTSISAEPSLEYTSFEKDASTKGGTQNDRRTKQAMRVVADTARNQQVMSIITELEDSIMSTKGNMAAILNPIQKLLDLEFSPTNLKQITASTNSKRLDYRLAWVGSDDSISHVCTGLHKVPLARLQEVFLTFTGRNRLQIREVISILGPFPNVCNVLQGSSEIVSGAMDPICNWNIVWDSMIDGTGKELLAGNAQNKRVVDLNVYYRDENVIVLVVPPSTNADTKSAKKVGNSYRSNPLEDNGKHVLVFTKETNMDAKLDSLRVS